MISPVSSAATVSQPELQPKAATSAAAPQSTAPADSVSISPAAHAAASSADPDHDGR
jgi:hypothetical protein